MEDTIASSTIVQKLEEVKAARNAASIRAGQLQEELQRRVAQVHQLDGAIAAMTQLLNSALQAG